MSDDSSTSTLSIDAPAAEALEEALAAEASAANAAVEASAEADEEPPAGDPMVEAPTADELRRRLEAGEKDFAGTDFGGLDLRCVDFSHANLSDCRLEDALLEGASFQYANLEGANLEGTTASNTQFYGCRYDRRTRWPRAMNFRSLQAFGPGSSLECAHLVGVALPGADLRGADFSGAEMVRCRLDGAKMEGASLVQADLLGAWLRDVDLRGANLRRARLRRCRLDGADLRGADLRGADLREISSNETRFEDARSDFRTRWPQGFDQARTMGKKVGRLPVWIVYIPIFWPLILYLLLGRALYLLIWRMNNLSAHLVEESPWPLLDDFAFNTYGFHNDKRFALSWPLSWPLIFICSALLLFYAGLWTTWSALRRAFRGGVKFANEVIDLLWTWTKS